MLSDELSNRNSNGHIGTNCQETVIEPFRGKQWRFQAVASVRSTATRLLLGKYSVSVSLEVSTVRYEHCQVDFNYHSINCTIPETQDHRFLFPTE